jgi:two-component system response regulator HydG
MQVSLLRVLEEKKLERVGGNQSIETQFRLVSATHRDLAQLIKQDLFREDFFYRINVITIDVPPLRERPDDIPVLADFFIEKYATETGKRIEGITQKGLASLASYPWPGNVRELRNVIERAVVIARGHMIGAEELSFLHSQPDTDLPGARTLQEVELQHLKACLESCDWNVTQAAKQLGIDRVTLSRKMKRHKITRPQ